MKNVNEAAFEAWLRSIKGQIDLINSTLDCLTERVVLLERNQAAAVPAVRLPKIKLSEVNSKLEGGDVA